VGCETQQEIDELSRKLTGGGEQGPCGWLKDPFGVSLARAHDGRA
jgi:predicted 3-demethylubiquinone-9 3-methyltransferase (glyoxalase superfamily)